MWVPSPLSVYSALAVKADQVSIRRQRNVLKRAGIVGLFVAVILLVEHAERLIGHVNTGKVDFYRTACAVGCAIQF